MSKHTPSLRNRTVAFLVQRSNEHYRPEHIVLASLTGGSLELILIPLFFINVGQCIDKNLAFNPLLLAPMIFPIAFLCFINGIPWLAWSIYWQHHHGRGTPLPLVPTKKLLDQGPYRYCRNPMNWGAIFWLMGWAVIANSPTAFMGVGIFVISVFSYTKLIEERELQQRFGPPYEYYRKTTPFLIPSLVKLLTDIKKIK